MMAMGTVGHGDVEELDVASICGVKPPASEDALYERDVMRKTMLDTRNSMLTLAR